MVGQEENRQQHNGAVTGFDILDLLLVSYITMVQLLNHSVFNVFPREVEVKMVFSVL